MFWFIVDILMLRRLGLGRPFRFVLLVLLYGFVIAGLIYVCVVSSALGERRAVPDVHAYSNH